MGKKVSDDKLREYVDQINKEALIDWLVEQCRDDNTLRSSLLDLAAPKEAVDSLVSEIRSCVNNVWAKARSRDGYRQAGYDDSFVRKKAAGKQAAFQEKRQWSWPGD